MSAGQLWREYLFGKQSYRQLAQHHHCSLSTIRRRLDRQPALEGKPGLPSRAVVVMDTTYFGRKFGVMLFKDALSGSHLLAASVKYETNALYRAAIHFLQQQQCHIQAIVCDGRTGLFNSFAQTPVQMCQFHQIAIVRRYLTGRPKHPAAQALWVLSLSITRSQADTFARALQQWLLQWQDFINERKIHPATGCSRYVHRRLRSAYLSVQRNLPYLFTFQRYPALEIPNTTNAVDGTFANLKNSLRNHNGLSRNRKIKAILHFLNPHFISHFEH